MEKTFFLRKEELGIIVLALKKMDTIKAWSTTEAGIANELRADLIDEIKHYDDTKETIKKRFGLK